MQRRDELIEPDDYDVVLSLGNAYFDVGYFGKENEALQKAREYYYKGTCMQTRRCRLRTDLGLTYFLQTPPDYRSAVAEFEKSLADDPKHEKTLQFSCQTLVKLEQVWRRRTNISNSFAK